MPDQVASLGTLRSQKGLVVAPIEINVTGAGDLTTKTVSARWYIDGTGRSRSLLFELNGTSTELAVTASVITLSPAANPIVAGTAKVTGSEAEHATWSLLKSYDKYTLIIGVKDAAEGDDWALSAEWEHKAESFAGDVTNTLAGPVTVDTGGTTVTAEVKNILGNTPVSNDTPSVAMVLVHDGTEWTPKPREIHLLSYLPSNWAALTNHQSYMDAAATAARANGIKRVVMPTGDLYYPSQTQAWDVSDINLRGSNTRIIGNRSSGTGYLVKAEGSIHSFSGTTEYALSSNAVKRDSWVEVDNATASALVDEITTRLAANTPVLINIRSPKIYAPLSGENVLQGEMHLVNSVIDQGGGIRRLQFSDSIADPAGYLTSDTAVVRLVDYTEASITGVTLHEPNEVAGAYGLSLLYTFNADIDVRVTKMHGICVNIDGCFASHIRERTFDSPVTGFGYGVSISNASMYTVVYDSVFLGCRHAVTLGGSGSSSGVPWRSLIRDTRASPMFATSLYNAHASVGDVEFNNVKGDGGLLEDGTLANEAFGFEDMADITLIDCEASDFKNGIVLAGSVGASARRIKIENFSGRNLAQVAFTHTLPVDELEIGKITDVWTRIDAFPDAGRYSVNIGGAVITKLIGTVGPIYAEEKNALIVGTASMPEDFAFDTEARFDSVAATGMGVRIQNTGLKRIRGKIAGHQCWRTFEVQSPAALDLLDLNVRYSTESEFGHFHLNGGTYGTVKVRGHIGSSRGAGRFGVQLTSADITLLDMDFEGSHTDLDSWLHDAGSTVTYVKHGGNLRVFGDFTDTESVLELIAGSVNEPRILGGYGDPRTVVTAPAGCLYLRSDGRRYINTDGATAWKLNPREHDITASGASQDTDGNAVYMITQASSTTQVLSADIDVNGHFVFSNQTDSTVTLTTEGAETINGDATMTIQNYESRELKTYGGNLVTI